MREWIRHNILAVTAVVGVSAGILYVQITRSFGEPPIWVMLIAAALTIYGYFAGSRPWPRVPMPLLLISAFVWMGCAVGQAALHYLSG